MSSPTRTEAGAWEWRPTTEMAQLLAENRHELLKDTPVSLSRRERIALVVGTDLTAETAFTMDLGIIRLPWLTQHRIGLSNLLAADLLPLRLFRLGAATTAEGLEALGFDALSIFMTPRIAQEATSLFGASACRAVWLRSASDALALAGASEACCCLDATLERLLEACCAAPDVAEAVLGSIKNPGLCLRAVSVGVLVGTCIDSARLTRVQVTLNDVMAAGASALQLRQLGYKALQLLG